MFYKRQFFIIGSLASSVLSVLFMIISLSTYHWVEAQSVRLVGAQQNIINYGLYGGKMVTAVATESSTHNLYMTCIVSPGACAISCKTSRNARRDEVRDSADGRRQADPQCNDFGFGNETIQGQLPIISIAFYVILNIFLYVQLLTAICSTAIAILNLRRDQEKFNLRVIIICSAVSAFMGTLVLYMWGLHFTRNLKYHLAFVFVSLPSAIFEASIGYSYWLLLPAVVCSLSSVVFAYLGKEVTTSL